MRGFRKFNIEIAAQMSAWFISKTKKGRLSHMKLIKLLYLSERAHIEKYNQPISGDQMLSMKNGPVLARTLSFIQGEIPPNHSQNWDKWISPKENHKVSLVEDFDEAKLTLLSKAIIEIMAALWDEHKSKNQWELNDYTHEFCKEWTDPSPFSTPIEISYATLYSKGFNRNSKDVVELATNLEDQRQLIHEFYELNLEE